MRIPLWSANVGLMLALLAISTNALRSDVFAVDLSRTVELVTDKKALVSGAFSCKGVGNASVSAVVTQSVGKTNVTGTGDLGGLSASASPQMFNVSVSVVQPPDGQFRKGPARLVVDISCGAANETLSAEVRLGN